MRDIRQASQLLAMLTCMCALPALTTGQTVAPAGADAIEPRVNTSAAAVDDKAPVKPVAEVATTKVAPATGTVVRGPAVSNAGGGARVIDRVELENSQITGNRELPRVMYVVPWKKPDLGDFGGRPAKSLLDELLQPLDRDVFKRQVRYFDALRPDAANGAAPAVTRDEK